MKMNIRSFFEKEVDQEKERQVLHY